MEFDHLRYLVVGDRVMDCLSRFGSHDVKTFRNIHEATRAMITSGIGDLVFETTMALGGMIKPVILCEFEADAERVMSLGYEARMINEYAYD